MRWTAKWLMQEFCGFLSGRYGTNWTTTLKDLRFRNVHDRVPLEWKRTRGVEEELSCYHDCELLRDAEVGCDAISRFAGANWWSWNQGSTLVF
jgi:hypothetical protein